MVAPINWNIVTVKYYSINIRFSLHITIFLTAVLSINNNNNNISLWCAQRPKKMKLFAECHNEFMQLWMRASKEFQCTISMEQRNDECANDTWESICNKYIYIYYISIFVCIYSAFIIIISICHHKFAPFAECVHKLIVKHYNIIYK